GDIKNQKTSWYLCDVDDYNFTINKKELKDAGYFTEKEMQSMKVWSATKNVFKKYVFKDKKHFA
ncbi:unnamed protein product, partial [marine sediment metagenome]